MFRLYHGKTIAFPGESSLSSEAASSPSTKTKKPIIRTLEPRMVFDAAGAAAVHHSMAPAHHVASGDAAHVAAADSALKHLAEALTAAHVAPVERPAAAEKSVPAEPVAAHAGDDDRPAAAPREVFLVWDNVRDWRQIVSDLGDTARVHVLDSSKDGVEQIAAILGGQSGVSAVHLISHGAEGSLNLGTAVLDADSMRGRYHDALTTIGRALSKEGDILIYGCDFAAGARGLQAANILGGITHADIAASTDPTGAAARGGDWDLERQTGAIEATVFADHHYQFLLAPPAVDLDGTFGSTGDSTASYTEGTAPVSIVSTGAFGATIVDSDGDLQTITITAGAAPNGDAEHLSFNGVAVGLGSDSTNTVVVGATTYRIDYTAATRTFIISNDGGGTIPSGGDTNTLVRSITYDNSSDDPTNAGADTDRIFSFTATDVALATSAASTATVSIAAINNPPVNTLPGAGWTTTEDTAVQLTGLQVADPDAGNEVIAVTLSVTSGSIDATSGGGVIVGGTATDRTLTGTLADINAYLASASAPTYTPAADANGNITLTMTTTDNGHTGGAAMTDVDTGTITTNPANDAPEGADNTVTIVEDNVYTFSAGVFGFADPNDTPANSLQAVIITTLPSTAEGTLLLNGVAVTAGQTIAVAQLGNLTFQPAADVTGNGVGVHLSGGRQWWRR